MDRQVCSIPRMTYTHDPQTTLIRAVADPHTPNLITPTSLQPERRRRKLPLKLLHLRHNAMLQHTRTCICQYIPQDQHRQS